MRELHYSDLLDARATEGDLVRGLLGDVRDGEKFFRFCRWLHGAVCHRCGSVAEPVVAGAQRECSECGERVTGHGMRVVPHLEMCRLACAGGEKRGRMFLWPRGSYKSTVIVLLYAVWRVLHEPNIRILIDSETRGLSGVSLKFVKRVFESQRFRAAFGNWTGQEDGSKPVPGWTEERITISRRTRDLREATVEISGVDNAVTGRHYDLILLDDVVSERNVGTLEMRGKVRSHFLEVLRLADPHCEIVVAGTPWHLGDIYGWIRAEESFHEEFDIHVRSAEGPENRRIYGEERRRQGWTEEQLERDGDLLFPEVLSRRFLARQRAKDATQYSFQYLCQPVVPELSLGTCAGYFLEVPDVGVVIGVDTATGSRFSTSFTGFAVAGMDSPAEEDAFFGDFYVLEAYARNYQSPQILDEIFSLALKYRDRLRGVVVEKAGNDTFVDTLQMEMRRRGIFFPLHIEPAGAATGKEQRIRSSLQPQYHAGRVHHAEHLRGSQYEDQLVQFGATEDLDILDAMSRVFLRLRPPGQRAAAESPAFSGIVPGNSTWVYEQLRQNPARAMMRREMSADRRFHRFPGSRNLGGTGWN